jgi:hypothetical protein
MRLYHATSANNIESIQEKGLISRFEGVYLTDSIESAQRWIGFRLRAQGENLLAVVEVEVDESKLEEGTDHSPMMVQLFGVGKSFLSPKNIPAKKIVEIHLFQMGGNN